MKITAVFIVYSKKLDTGLDIACHDQFRSIFDTAWHSLRTMANRNFAGTADELLLRFKCVYCRQLFQVSYYCLLFSWSKARTKLSLRHRKRRRHLSVGKRPWKLGGLGGETKWQWVALIWYWLACVSLPIHLEEQQPLNCSRRFFLVHFIFPFLGFSLWN